MWPPEPLALGRRKRIGLNRTIGENSPHLPSTEPSLRVHGKSYLVDFFSHTPDMSSPWTKEFASGCWISGSRYEGPHSTESAYKFIIAATLEPGAEKYFSGFRVLIGCNSTEEKLAALVRATLHVVKMLIIFFFFFSFRKLPITWTWILCVTEDLM